MAEFKLYCFGESGNCLQGGADAGDSAGCDWQPVWVDFFNGETRHPEYRARGQ